MVYKTSEDIESLKETSEVTIPEIGIPMSQSRGESSTSIPRAEKLKRLAAVKAEAHRQQLLANDQL